MDTPLDTAHFPAMAADIGVTLTPSRLTQAEQTHRLLRPAVERLRALPLPFVASAAGGPVDEPDHALQHIAAGRGSAKGAGA